MCEWWATINSCIVKISTWNPIFSAWFSSTLSKLFFVLLWFLYFGPISGYLFHNISPISQFIFYTIYSIQILRFVNYQSYFYIHFIKFTHQSFCEFISNNIVKALFFKFLGYLSKMFHKLIQLLHQFSWIPHLYCASICPHNLLMQNLTPDQL